MDNNKNFHFKILSFKFKVRDFFNPPVKILKDLGVKKGQYVLDFGCGPGGFSLAASRLIGSTGKIYALDVNPVAIDRLNKISIKKKLYNINTILSDCKTGLSDNSIDLILLFDIYHELEDYPCVLEELYGVLKPEGVLAVSDHHLSEEKIISEITKKGLFKLDKENGKIYTFLKSKS